jgi:hypothetical protein
MVKNKNKAKGKETKGKYPNQERYAHNISFESISPSSGWVWRSHPVPKHRE